MEESKQNRIRKLEKDQTKCNLTKKIERHFVIVTKRTPDTKMEGEVSLVKSSIYRYWGQKPRK